MKTIAHDANLILMPRWTEITHTIVKYVKSCLQNPKIIGGQKIHTHLYCHFIYGHPKLNYKLKNNQKKEKKKKKKIKKKGLNLPCP